MNIEQVSRVIRKFRELDPDMPIGVPWAFIHVAIHEGDNGISLSDLAERADFGLSTASRYIAALSKINRHREDGFNLVVMHENPMERRQKLISLSPKGRAFLNRLLEDK